MPLQKPLDVIGDHISITSRAAGTDELFLLWLRSPSSACGFGMKQGKKWSLTQKWGVLHYGMGCSRKCVLYEADEATNRT